MRTSATLFTWGYHGWANHTSQLVKAFNSVETSRGFHPPIFVDIRSQRSGRAPGFIGSAFEKLLGPDHHHWMKSLGNLKVKTRTGPEIQIAEPAAAEELRDLALESARNKQRLLFFCSRVWPRWNGKIGCHRTTVAGLVLKAARKRGKSIQIVEWPGGEPRRIDLNVKPRVFDAVKKGRMSIPLGKRPDLAEVAGLPWGSIATLHSGGETLQRGDRQHERVGLAGPSLVFRPRHGAEGVRESSGKVPAGVGTESSALERSPPAGVLDSG